MSIDESSFLFKKNVDIELPLKIILTDHFNNERIAKRSDARCRRPGWFDFRVACFLVMQIEKRLKSIDDGCYTLRLEMGDRFQYFLLKLRETSDFKEIVFLSGLSIKKNQSLLPYREVDFKNRLDFEGDWSIDSLLRKGHSKNVIEFIKSQNI